MRTRVQTLRDFKDIRVKYIVGEITKQELSDHIFRNDKLMQKNTELINVYELLSAVGIDLFIRLLANQNIGEIFMTDIIEQISQYDKLRVYCNELFAVISNTYSMTVPQITQNWLSITDKFNGKDLKIINEKAAASTAHNIPISTTIASVSSSAAPNADAPNASSALDTASIA